MAEITPLRRRMIEDMQVRNLSPVTQRCYVHAVAKLARHFKSIARPARAGGNPGLSDPPHHDRHLVGRLQRRGLRPALLLRRHPRPHRDRRAHPLRTQAPATTGNPQR